ncbi:hypothetical protein BC830DRAFT_1159270 [Chytriomyces sp. MP71]|nr:hypothetical protein BC830DRAFT_1159270 [Chytriomyces sp. MP71]
MHTGLPPPLCIRNAALRKCAQRERLLAPHAREHLPRDPFRRRVRPAPGRQSSLRQGRCRRLACCGGWSTCEGGCECGCVRIGECCVSEGVQVRTKESDAPSETALSGIGPSFQDSLFSL